MRLIQRAVPPIAAALALTVLPGCYEESSPPPPTTSASDTANSSLGKAKDAANRVIDDAEAKSGQLADDIERGLTA